MKKRMKALAAQLCYLLGILGALYVGGWMMLLSPIHDLVSAFTTNNLSLPLVLICLLKILFSSTFAGLVWCIGYIGCNHFKGTDDPDWDLLEKKNSGKLK